MKPFAVDANAIALFQRERVAKQPDEGMAAIEAICVRNCIALDQERLCLQEWMDSAQGAFPFALADWIGDMMATGRIRYYSLSKSNCRKRLLDLGLPKKDHKWVKLALGCGGNLIVTGDVDFFDPTKKLANSEVKRRLKRSGNGPCSKALRKEYGIKVIDTAAVPEYLALT